MLNFKNNIRSLILVPFLVAEMFTLLDTSYNVQAANNKTIGSIHNELVAKFSTSKTSPKTIAALKRIADSDKSICLIINENSIIVSQNLGHSADVDLKVNNHQMTV